MYSNKKYPFRTTFIDDRGIRHDVRAKSQDELYDKIARVKKEIEEGYVPIRANTTTVKQWADKCFDVYKANIARNSLSIQKQCFDKWVSSNIGNLKIKDVTPLHCQDTITKTAGLSDYTIHRVYQLMRFVFNKAVDNSLIRKSPAERLTLPKGAKTERRSLTKHEEDIFINTVEKHPEYVFFLVMLKCGLRNSEVARLQGKDVITIEGERFLHVNGTKTENATRDVPCPDYLAERLPDVSPFEYMFKNRVGGKMNKPNYERLWKHLVRDMNIEAGCRVYRNALVPPYPIADDLVSYDLRHTYCTNLALQGVDLRIASKLMGHSNIHMTADIYSHATNESLVKVAKMMNEEAKNRAVTIEAKA